MGPVVPTSGDRGPGPAHQGDLETGSPDPARRPYRPNLDFCWGLRRSSGTGSTTSSAPLVTSPP